MQKTKLPLSTTIKQIVFIIEHGPEMAVIHLYDIAVGRRLSVSTSLPELVSFTSSLTPGHTDTVGDDDHCPSLQQASGVVYTTKQFLHSGKNSRKLRIQNQCVATKVGITFKPKCTSILCIPPQGWYAQRKCKPRLRRNLDFGGCAMLLNAEISENLVATQKLIYDFVVHTNLGLTSKKLVGFQF